MYLEGRDTDNNSNEMLLTHAGDLQEVCQEQVELFQEKSKKLRSHQSSTFSTLQEVGFAKSETTNVTHS